MPKKKILIVEDELPILEPYRDYLTAKGYEVETAKDGKEGLEKAQTFDYDLMLLDIMMPVMDGLEVLKRVKANAKLSNKKIILLTALGRESVIKEGFGLGADGYLLKDQETPDTIEKNIAKILSN